MKQATEILRKIEDDPSMAEALLPLLYDDLKALASARLRRESSKNDLQTTSLVHEAYYRLVDVDAAKRWNSRAHFFGAAAEAMRRILVDEARKRKSLKRGGVLKRISGVSRLAAAGEQHDEEDRILVVSEALEHYKQVSERGCDVVKLRFFAGMTNEEVGQALGVSLPTVKRDWAAAKVWIYRYLRDADSRG